MGSYKGMAHLTDLFKINVSIQMSFYNSIIANENCIVLPKKLRSKIKLYLIIIKNITNFLILIEIKLFKNICHL